MGTPEIIAALVIKLVWALATDNDNLRDDAKSNLVDWLVTRVGWRRQDAGSVGVRLSERLDRAARQVHALLPEELPPLTQERLPGYLRQVD